jgi:hypothetical protein
MKILKHDIDAKSWKYEITCYYCKTQLEVVASDVSYSGERGDWHDSGWEKYTIFCPECGTPSDIPPDKIHNLVAAKIRNRNTKWF